MPSRRRRPARPSTSPRRLVVLFVLFLLVFSGIGLRLAMLQVVDAPAFARMAVAQRKRVITFPARRGTVFDRSGEPLAISVDLQTVYADPTLIENPQAASLELGRILDEDPDELETKLRGTRPGSRFEYLARQVEPKVAKRIEALELQGIFVEAEPKRYYPNHQVASHVIGFADIDGNGVAGVELQYDEILQGEPGRMSLEQDPQGVPLPQADFTYDRPEAGRSLFLTIDKELQYFTEVALARGASTYHAESGTAVVLRPRTGEVLALANVPDFDPNKPSRFPEEAWRNRAVTDMYEPGSVYKIVTASGALNAGVVTPRTKLVVPDELAYSDRVFHDSHSHATEVMTTTEIIEQSSNVGTIKVGLKLGGRRLDRYVRRFGFGSKTGLGFPGESPGMVLDRDEWSGSTIATIPIGQGIAVTPLQMANAFATIANNGVWIEPRLLYGTMNNHGRLHPGARPARRRVVSRRTAVRMKEILAGVTTRGTGLLAQIPGYQVAGKTGTAQKPLPEGGYGNSYMASFGGFAPARHPRVVVLVVLDDPSPIWGGLTAAPTFKTITQFALRHLGVPPTGNVNEATVGLEEARSDPNVGTD